MKRFASIVVVILFMLPSISIAVSQDETATPDEGTAAEQTEHRSRNKWRKLPACDTTVSRKLEAHATEKSLTEAHAVAAAYLAAVLAGNKADAAALAAPETPPASMKQIDEMRTMLRGNRVFIKRVLNDERHDRVAAFTTYVKLAEPNPDGQDTGRLVFSLKRSGERWSITDIDFRTSQQREKEIQRHVERSEGHDGRAGQLAGEYRYEQSRNGVTVRIEKVTLDRVTNGPAWFRKAYGPDWQKHVTSILRTDSCSFRIVRIFVSVSGSVTKQALSCEFGRDQSRMDGVAEFGARGWRRQLPDMDVDPEATGLISWAIVEAGASIDQLFPVKVELDVIAEDGEKATFQFADLTL
jgi:hypothetical protein